MAKDDASAAGAEANANGEPAPGANRPLNTPFRQQTLAAWQPILTPRWVIGTFVVVGLVFVPVGALLYKLSDDLFESVVTYDSYDSSQITSGSVSGSCGINELNQGYTELMRGARDFNNCTLTFTFDEDIEESDTVYVYYQIDNFYQNHRRYVKSVSDTQLMNEVTINPIDSTSDSSLETSCDPSASFSTGSGSGTRVFYPCGLIALSVFNDGIELSKFERNGQTTELYAAGVPLVPSRNSTSLDRSDIAWQSDLDNKYKNPTDSGCSRNSPVDRNNAGGNLCPARYYQYEYLWQTYNQFRCYFALPSGAPDLSKPATCVNYTEFVDQNGRDFYGSANWESFLATVGGKQNMKGICADCVESDALLVSAGGILPPQDPSSETSAEGVRNEGFIVWMRTAGLPTFRKLYGKLTPPPGGFKAGDKVSFSVVPNFLVSTIEGSKSLVLGTTSPLGGKNDILGIAYMTVGAICITLAIAFAIKMKVNPRKLGDPRHLHWKKA